MLSLALALVAGALTTLSPCVLPILPIVLFGALDQHRHAPLALACGLALSFTVFGLLLSGAALLGVGALDISEAGIRNGAAVLMVLFGVVLASSALRARYAAASSPLGAAFHGLLERIAPAPQAGEATGAALWRQFGLGAVLGAVWSPCSGPTLGAAVSLAGKSGSAAQAGAVMLVFGIGATLPMLLIAYGSRQGLKSRREALSRISRAATPWLGALLALAGVLVLTGLDKQLETYFVDNMPDWLVRLTTRF